MYSYFVFKILQELIEQENSAHTLTFMRNILKKCFTEKLSNRTHFTQFVKHLHLLVLHIVPHPHS